MQANALNPISSDEWISIFNEIKSCHPCTDKQFSAVIQNILENPKIYMLDIKKPDYESSIGWNIGKTLIYSVAAGYYGFSSLESLFHMFDGNEKLVSFITGLFCAFLTLILLVLVYDCQIKVQTDATANEKCVNIIKNNIEQITKIVAQRCEE
jgi:hypothetical protein